MTPEVARIHAEAPLTDVHIHPSLKAYLFRRNLWRHYRSSSGFNPFTSRSDFRMLQKGGVKIIWVPHYLPEQELANCFWIRLAAFLLIPVYQKLLKGPRIQRVQEMIDNLERQVLRHPELIEVARSPMDVKRIVREGKMAVVHAVEGAHVLEGRIENLDVLAQRGVAYLTLSHFFDNGVAAQVNGIPQGMFINRICSFDVQAMAGSSLTPFGREVVRRMMELGILVDVTHCTPEARAAVFAEIDAQTPVLATHIGARALNPDVYNLSDDEILEIQRSGGAVGVIFMNYWLDPEHTVNGLEAIWRTIEQVHQVTGSWDHIMLGTDFDGFTEPPEEVKDASRMGQLTQLLMGRGLDQSAIRKILGANAQRVLEDGWGKSSARSSSRNRSQV